MESIKSELLSEPISPSSDIILRKYIRLMDQGIYTPELEVFISILNQSADQREIFNKFYHKVIREGVDLLIQNKNEAFKLLKKQTEDLPKT